jgi:ribosomal protein L16 Arg81 hydroxylase
MTVKAGGGGVSVMISVQKLFGDVAAASFVAEYWHRLPWARSGAARRICALGSWETLGEILRDADANVLVVHDGEQCAGVRPTRLEAAQALSGEGKTILVRHAERHHPGLGELARAFEQSFCGPVDVQMFVTPAGQAGFSWHYDAEDVFILQTAGQKEYGLRKNTVNPWPVEETLPADMQYGREIMPLVRVTLKAGDLLYIPCGYWHKADATASAEAAISLAVGVMSPAAIGVLDFLRPRLLESMLWRQRLPVAGNASPMSGEELMAAYRELFGKLGEDLVKRLKDPLLLKDFVEAMESGGRVRKD